MIRGCELCVPHRAALLRRVGSAAPRPQEAAGRSRRRGRGRGRAEAKVEIDPEIFDTALADFYAERYADAAAGFWGYMHFGDESAENYEWAEFFLAECLRELGLWHAAVQYYYLVAKTRSHPEILPGRAVAARGDCRASGRSARSSSTRTSSTTRSSASCRRASRDWVALRAGDVRLQERLRRLG